MFFFFFKQKTAYEMRISDWSSDVCSSDLGRIEFAGELHHDRLDERIERRCSRERDRGRKRTYQRTDLIARIGTRCVDGKPVGNITPRRQRQVLALVADTQREPVTEDEPLRGARSRLGVLLPGIGKKRGPQIGRAHV